MVIGKVTTRSFHVAAELTPLVGTSYSHRLHSTSRNSRNQRPVFPVESTGTPRARESGHVREKKNRSQDRPLQERTPRETRRFLREETRHEWVARSQRDTNRSRLNHTGRS